MKRAILCIPIALAPFGLVWAESKCPPPVGDVELYEKLATQPYFSNGVPPRGRKMRVEREECGFRIYVGSSGAGSFDGDLLLVDGQGKITKIIRSY